MSNFGLCPGRCEGVSWKRKFLLYSSEECSFVCVLVGSAVGLILKTLPLGSSSNLISVLVFFLLKSIYLFGCVGLSCGMQDLSLWHARWVAHGMWDLVPWPGIEPKSPASEGGLLTPGPPRKSVSSFILGLAAWRLLHTRIVGLSGELGSICRIRGFLSFLLFFFFFQDSSLIFQLLWLPQTWQAIKTVFFYQSFSCSTWCVSEIGLLGNQTTFVFISTCGFDLGCCQQAELLIFTSL